MLTILLTIIAFIVALVLILYFVCAVIIAVQTMKKEKLEKERVEQVMEDLKKKTGNPNL